MIAIFDCSYQTEQKLHNQIVSDRHRNAVYSFLTVSPELQCFVQYLVCRVELHGHAQSAVEHVVVAVLCAECLVRDLEAGGAVYGPVNPRHLQHYTTASSSQAF